VSGSRSGSRAGPDGKPSANAEVQIREYNPGARSITAPDVETDEQGRYVYADIRWAYTVGVLWERTPPGTNRTWHQYLRCNQIWQGSQTINFQFEEFPQGPCSLSGHVLEQGGQPIEEFTIDIRCKVDWDDYSPGYLHQFGYKLPLAATDGRYEITGLPPGQYTILAIPKNQMAVPPGQLSGSPQPRRHRH